MKKIAQFIVDKRVPILILFILFCVYAAMNISRVNIEYTITAYLPDDTDTKKAIDIMDAEFTTFSVTKVLLRNITFEQADMLAARIAALEGVKSLPFENTADYYNRSCALFSISFEGDDEDFASLSAWTEIQEMLSPYDALVSSALTDDYAAKLSADVSFILLLAIGVIILVLTFTSKSFAEVIVFLLVFGVSALLNMGTNFWLGRISYISNTVCVILQLALAIDYAIILCHRFAQEKEKNGNRAREAMAQALAKAIPEIAGSSLTTIAGLLALCTMTLRLGADLGIVLAKSIICSILTVFLLMPGLMLLFSKPIDRTTHRNFVPKITGFGKSVLFLRHVLPVCFLALAMVSMVLSFRVDYVYSLGSIDTPRPTEEMQANALSSEIFGYTNTLVILVPHGETETQLKILNMVSADPMISSATGISNVELTRNGESHYLNEKMTYRRFATFAGMDESTAKSIYAVYAGFSESDFKDGLGELAVFEANPDIYGASILDLCDCAFEHDDFFTAYLADKPDVLDTYRTLRDTVLDAEAQLVGTNYDRLVFVVDGEVESPETFALIERLTQSVKEICPGAIFAGDSMSSYDLNQSFGGDMIKVSVITAAAVYLILLFTFRSWLLPLPLVLTIQGAIFINFAIPVINSTNLFFFVYLIISSIQMGATIDYAIVLTNRFQVLKKETTKKHAVIQTLNEGFPTIVTSGSIMAVCGFLIQYLVSDPLISTMGACLGRGVLVSIVCVMLVLPAFLFLFEKILDKTNFTLSFFANRPKPRLAQELDNVLRSLKKAFPSVMNNISGDSADSSTTEAAGGDSALPSATGAAGGDSADSSTPEKASGDSTDSSTTEAAGGDSALPSATGAVSGDSADAATPEENSPPTAQNGPPSNKKE